MTTLSPEDERLDVARAARQGMDVSSVPREERCKYPSKFCGNARASKSSGKLHRFCEFHRQRANVNQKRWTKVRRTFKHEMNMDQHNMMIMASMNNSWPMQWNSYDLLPSSPTDATVFPSYVQPQPQYYQSKNHPTLAPRMEVTQREDASGAPLSADELHILMSFLLPSESIDSVGAAQQATPYPLVTPRHWIPSDDFGYNSSGVFDPTTINVL